MQDDGLCRCAPCRDLFLPQYEWLHEGFPFWLVLWAETCHYGWWPPSWTGPWQMWRSFDCQWQHMLRERVGQWHRSACMSVTHCISVNLAATSANWSLISSLLAIEEMQVLSHFHQWLTHHEQVGAQTLFAILSWLQRVTWMEPHDITWVLQQHAQDARDAWYVCLDLSGYFGYRVYIYSWFRWFQHEARSLIHGRSPCHWQLFHDASVSVTLSCFDVILKLPGALFFEDQSGHWHGNVHASGLSVGDLIIGIIEQRLSLSDSAFVWFRETCWLVYHMSCGMWRFQEKTGGFYDRFNLGKDCWLVIAIVISHCWSDPVQETIKTVSLKQVKHCQGPIWLHFEEISVLTPSSLIQFIWNIIELPGCHLGLGDRGTCNVRVPVTWSFIHSISLSLAPWSFACFCIDIWINAAHWAHHVAA